MDMKMNSSRFPNIAENARESFNNGLDTIVSGMRMPEFRSKTNDDRMMQQSPLLNSRKQSTLIRMKQGFADPIGSLMESKLDDYRPEGQKFDLIKIRAGNAYDASYRPKVIRKTPF